MTNRDLRDQSVCFLTVISSGPLHGAAVTVYLLQHVAPDCCTVTQASDQAGISVARFSVPSVRHKAFQCWCIQLVGVCATAVEGQWRGADRRGGDGGGGGGHADTPTL